MTAQASRVIGLVASDPVAWARSRGAELVDFGAVRGERFSPRTWLEHVAAIDGRGARESEALVASVLKRSGLDGAASIRMLPALARAVLAVAEVAVAIGRDPSAYTVVVPQPPAPLPQRDDVRRVALALMTSAEVVLHAFEPIELAPWMPREAIVDAAGRALAPVVGRAIVARVYGVGAPYDAWRASLEARGVVIAGGPVSHVISGEGFTPRDVLAAAHEAGLDVLDVHDPLDGA